MSESRITFTDQQLRVGLGMGITHVIVALALHFAVPRSMEQRLGLEADPWFRRETGTVNAGFAYGMFQILRGNRDTAFLRSTSISGLLMAGVRTVATLRGKRRGLLSAFVVSSDLVLGIGGLVLANQFDREASIRRELGYRPIGMAASETAKPMASANGTRKVKVQ